MAKFLDENNDIDYKEVVVSSEDVIDATDEAFEAMTLTNEIDTEIELHKSGLETRDLLATNIELYKDVLAKEDVDSSAVVLAKASLENICVQVGASSDYYAISTESMDETPRLALEVALESSDSILTKIIAKLKQFVAFIVKSISKATLSIMTSLSRVEKSAEAFIKTVGNSDKKGDLNDGVKGYPDGLAKGIKGKFGTLIASHGGGSKFVKGDIDKMVTGVKKIKDNFKALSALDKDALEKGTGKLNFQVTNGSAIYQNPHKLFPDFPQEYIGGNSAKFITRYDGTLGRIALFKVTDGKTKVTYFEGTIKKDQYDKAKLETVIGYSDIVSLAEDAKDIAKGIKDTKSEGDKALDNIKKIVEAVGKDSDSNLSKLEEAATKDGADQAAKDAYKAAKETSKTLISAVDAYAHVAPKAVLDSTWMMYKTSVNLLWLAQKTYGLYK